MTAGDVILLVTLSVSFIAAVKVSNSVLWYKVQHVFDLECPPLQDSAVNLGLLRTHGSGFLSKFYSEFSLSSEGALKAIRFLFASSFALCLLVMELTLWQIITFNANSSSRSELMQNLWLLVSIVLAFILLLVQPFLILLSVLDKFYGDKVRMSYLILTACAAILGWITTLNTLHWGPFYHPCDMLTKLSVIGVTVMAFLSGVASTSTPYYVYQLIRYKSTARTPVSWLDGVLIKERRREYEIKVQEGLAVLRKMEMEPNAYQSAIRQQQVEEIGKYQLELAKLAPGSAESTFISILKKGFQIGFLIYCVYKLLNTFLWRIPLLTWHSLQYPTDHTYEYFRSTSTGGGFSDPLAVTLANFLNFLLFRFKDQQDKDSLAKQISLVLSVSLFACSVTTVVSTASYLTNLLPARLQVLALRSIQSNSTHELLPTSNKQPHGKLKRPSVIKNLLISELTGVYVLATILMIRSNLPFDVAKQLNFMLGEEFGVPELVIDAWFDKVFAASSLLSIIGIKVAEKPATRHRN